MTDPEPLESVLGPVAGGAAVSFVVGDDAGVEMIVGEHHLAVPMAEELLGRLVELGEAARSASEELGRRRQALADAAQADAARRAEAEALGRWAGWTPREWGLAPAGGGRWAAGAGVVSATLVSPDGRARAGKGVGAEAGAEAGLRLVVADEAGTEVATISVSLESAVTGVVRVYANGIDGYTRPPSGGSPVYLPRAERQALEAEDPWAGIDLTSSEPQELLAAVAGVSLVAGEWIRRIDAAKAAARDAEVARAGETERLSAEWRRKSRPAGRLPTKVLSEWCRAKSHIDYERSGIATGGWRVEPETIVGERRPREIETRRRVKAVGVAEVAYVARIAYFEARYRSRRMSKSLRFYPSDVDSLRQALPGFVVKVPEDHKVIFVAVDSPEYLEALDAALAEWILVGSPEDE